MRNLYLIILILGIFICAPAGASEGHQDEKQGHEEPAEGHGEHEEEEEGILEMDTEQREANGIISALVEQHSLSEEITAPGEVTINAYRSSQATPRISAQVVSRHARLGDQVKKGQALVTLSSVEMAEAQAGLLQADVEWQRVKKLGRKVVSEKRYIAAQVVRELAHAKVRAYGMTETQIKALLKQGDASRATGSFDLLSIQEGIVISDDFIVGEVAKSGRVLFEISDESVLWVEAQLSPADAALIAVGTPARVRQGGGLAWSPGRVVQLHHRLSEVTRTQSVRIEVDNLNDDLHPGQFVEAAVQTSISEPVVAVPREAVIMMQGDWTVFLVEGDELHPQPVEVGVTRGDWTEIRSGLPVGETIVVQGVFMLKSLLLKSQMGEGHAH